MTDVITGSVVGHWISGHTEGGSRRSLLHDPATGELLGEVQLGDAGTVDRAVAAATDAAAGWAETPLSTRTRLIRRWGELISTHAGSFIEIMGRQQGKVRSDAQGELQRSLETLDVACSADLLLKGEMSDNLATGIDVFSIRAPLGVGAAITPFNFPLMAPVYLSSIALACGNAMIIKPSERVPSASLLLAELAEQAGIPSGALSVVQGDRPVVEAILDHPGVAAVSFIGSSPVARAVHARASASGKRVQAFGGAKNHMIVMPDADLEFAADAAVSAAYGSSGQRCMAISVLVAVGDCGDPLVRAVADRAGRIAVGPASQDGAEMGPLVSDTARDRVVAAIGRAEVDGARVVLDGRTHPLAEGSSGYFVGPTLVDEVHLEMALYRDEVFGPVLSVVRVPTLEDALGVIKANPYGNGAAIFTTSGASARQFQRQASAGMIGVNVPIPIPNAAYSFGGWDDSRFGDLHMAGTEGFRFYTKQKVVTARWPTPSRGSVSLAFPGR